MELSEQEQVRREKLEKIKSLGINPYPADLYPVSDYSIDIKNNFKENSKVVLAGRLMSRRIQGNASFAELQDSKGRIQLYFNRDEICSGEDKTSYNELYKKLLDIGDIIGVEGELFKTKVGEKEDEVYETLDDLINVNVDIVTLGQYLQPSKKHLPVSSFITPETFKKYEDYAIKLGFKHIESGPLVRSSYKAHKHIN